MNVRQLTGLDHYWLPFTPNRYFQDHPKILASAKGAYYTTDDGRRLFDCLSGMWCCPLGHGHPRIVEALTRQAQTLDYSPAFQFCNPVTLSLADRVAGMAPEGLTRVFFTNSGSEAVDTALKVAYGYHRLRGDASRMRFIGRERGYHGVGFGGMAVGGLGNNRKAFGTMIPGIDHLPHTYNREHQAFSRGEPDWGEHLADDLERIVALHSDSTIAGVIVEPMAGSTAVLPPPKGYLKRLRQICDKYGILLIFDEVITGFGRLGHAFAAERYGVIPDMICFAKGITNGCVPMGGVLVRRALHEAFEPKSEYAIDFFHGYTYTGHPLAAAAGIATLDLYRDEGLFERGRALETKFRDAVHALKGAPHVIDIRSVGLAAAIEMDSIAGAPGKRGYDVLTRAFFDEDLVVRISGDTIVLIPALIANEGEIARMTEGVRKVLSHVQ
jgi:beta-alanine--pyruvate transaminase